MVNLHKRLARGLYAITDAKLIPADCLVSANGKALVEAGADYLAVISGVFGQSDIRAAAQAYAKLFEESCS